MVPSEGRTPVITVYGPKAGIRDEKSTWLRICDGGPQCLPLVNLAVSELLAVTPRERRMMADPLLARSMLLVGGMRPG